MTQSQHNENQETIIRFSGTWWAYIVFRLGFLRAFVNGVEDALAITGRFLLLVFLIYCGAQAGLLLSDPNFSFPGWIEMGMFILQLAGLEGSIPGLARQGDVLRMQGDEKSAKKVDSVMLSARIMTVLAIGEGALHALHTPAILLQIISAILLLVRGIVITGFLWEKRKKDGHTVLATHFSAGYWWCDQCEPQRTFMELGLQLNYPQINVPRGFVVKSGRGEWLRFAEEAGYILGIPIS